MLPVTLSLNHHGDSTLLSLFEDEKTERDEVACQGHEPAITIAGTCTQLA